MKTQSATTSEVVDFPSLEPSEDGSFEFRVRTIVDHGFALPFGVKKSARLGALRVVLGDSLGPVQPVQAGYKISLMLVGGELHEFELTRYDALKLAAELVEIESIRHLSEAFPSPLDHRKSRDLQCPDRPKV